jgi:two-component system CheB/CheR fusion protein
LRQIVVFAPQNVLSDPPFSHVDLISFCNLLIDPQAGVAEKISADVSLHDQSNGFLFRAPVNQ